MIAFKAVEVTENWFVKFQSEVWESFKDSARTSQYSELIIYGVWPSWPEEPAMINKRPEPLKYIFDFIGTTIAG